MSYQTLIESISNEIGITTPVIPNILTNITDENLLQFNAHIYRTIREVTDRVEWPKLTKTCNITLVDGQAAYALPADLDMQIFRTFWDQNNFWELEGPTSAQEWEWRLHGVVTSTPRKRFRLIGNADNTFYLNPTPGAGDAGGIISFEYQSTSTIKPAQWTASTSYAANQYVSNNGIIYQTLVGGTSGSTAPTGTPPGVISDGGVDWLYTDIAYTRFIRSTDICLIDEMLISLGAQWRFLNEKTLPCQETKAEYEKALQRASVRSRGAKTISMSGTSASPFISSWNVPDTGYPEL